MKFLEIYNRIISETKQEFNLASQKQQIMKLLNDAFRYLKKGDQDFYFMCGDDIGHYIYKVLRYKKINLNEETVLPSDLMKFGQSVTKKCIDYDMMNSTWVGFYFNQDGQSPIRKTYSLYITPDIQYNIQDMQILDKALNELVDNIEALAKEKKVSFGLKFIYDFKKYFSQNDCVKLYAFDPRYISDLQKLQQQFLSNFQKKENNRIYKFGVDEGWSFGQKVSRQVAKQMMNYGILNNATPEQCYKYLQKNFLELVKYTSQELIKDIYKN